MPFIDETGDVRPSPRGAGLIGALVRATMIAALIGCRGNAAEKGETIKDDTARKVALADSGAAGKGMAGMNMASPTAAPDSAAAAGTQVTLTASQIRHGGVAWQPVTMGTAAAVVSVPGQLVPNEDRTARLGSPASGRVIAVRSRPGDRVARGQVLVTLQSPEAGGAQSDYRQGAGGAHVAARAGHVREKRPRPRGTAARAQGDPAAGLRARRSRRRTCAERGRSGGGRVEASAQLGGTTRGDRLGQRGDRVATAAGRRRARAHRSAGDRGRGRRAARRRHGSSDAVADDQRAGVDSLAHSARARQ